MWILYYTRIMHNTYSIVIASFIIPSFHIISCERIIDPLTTQEQPKASFLCSGTWDSILHLSVFFSSKSQSIRLHMSSRRRKESGPPAATTAAASSTPTTSRPSKRKAVPLASDADQVLRKCRQLRDAMRTEPVDDDDDDDDASSAEQPFGIPHDIIEVADLSSPQVLEAMESVALKVAQQVLSRKGFVLDIPSRASSNQIYVKEWDRIVLGGKRSTRTFLNVKEARKSAITLRGKCVCRHG